MPAVILKLFDVGYDTRKNKLKREKTCTMQLLAAIMTPKKKPSQDNDCQKYQNFEAYCHVF